MSIFFICLFHEINTIYSILASLKIVFLKRFNLKFAFLAPKQLSLSLTLFKHFFCNKKIQFKIQNFLSKNSFQTYFYAFSFSLTKLFYCERLRDLENPSLSLFKFFVSFQMKRKNPKSNFSVKKSCFKHLNSLLYSFYLLPKELSFCHKLKCSNLYICATWCCKPLIFQT